MSVVSKAHDLEFYYDISCPFAYIASTRIEALAARTGANLIWRPVLLGAIYRATDAPQGAAGSASDVFNPAKKAVTSAAFARTLRRHGVAYRSPPRHPVKTTAALRLLYSLDAHDRPRLSHALFRAYWVQGRDVADLETLTAVVRESGIAGAARLVRALESGETEGQAQRELLETATGDAVRRGSPGVPGFWIPEEVWIDRNGERRTGRLYWGQDRLHFVEAVLEALNQGRNGDSLSTIAKPLQSLVPRCVKRGIPAGEEVKLEFWYDFSSPWAFLGWTQLERLRRQYGDQLRIEMRPFLLGILFREIGAPNLPSAAISEQKRNYSRHDHTDWVRWWNAVNAQTGRTDKDIEFYWADIFPIRTPTALRAVMVEPKLVDAVFRACWERNMNVSSEKVLRDIIDEAGYDGERILARASEAEFKSRLREQTKAAREQGLCGVPSYRVFRRRHGQQDDGWSQTGDLVWGQDELDVVEDLISGWDGQSVAKMEDRDKGTSASRL